MDTDSAISGGQLVDWLNDRLRIEKASQLKQPRRALLRYGAGGPMQYPTSMNSSSVSRTTANNRILYTIDQFDRLGSGHTVHHRFR